MLIRPATLDDAPALLEIYNPVVLSSTATFDLIPRTLAEQQEWMSSRSGARVVLVAVDVDTPSTETGVSAGEAATGPIAGYSSLSPYRERPAYATTVEDSVYIHQDHRGRGVGGVLLRALIDTARSHGFHTMMARIVADHDASIRLHSSCGFVVVGHEREVGRKFNRWHDVITMQLML